MLASGCSYRPRSRRDRRARPGRRRAELRASARARALLARCPPGRRHLERALPAREQLRRAARRHERWARAWSRSPSRPTTRRRRLRGSRRARNRGERAGRRRGNGVGERSACGAGATRSCRRRRRAVCSCLRSSTSRPPRRCRSRSADGARSKRPSTRSITWWSRATISRPPAGSTARRSACASRSTAASRRAALRILFFRVGGVTLEVAGPLEPPAAAGAADRFGGLAYRVADVAAARARLAAAGFDVSPVRPGAKPGTLVCSVRAGTASVPTLLIGPAGQASDERGFLDILGHGRSPPTLRPRTSPTISRPRSRASSASATP